MTWNPKEAKRILDYSKTLNNTRNLIKISGYTFKSKRELVLITENQKEVVLFSSVVPRNMPGVVVKKEYQPTKTRSGSVNTPLIIQLFRRIFRQRFYTQ